MILDTNALSALADGDEGLAEKMASVSVPSLPSIVLGEFRCGILGSKFLGRYEAWLQNSLKAFAVVSVDGAPAVHYAAIRFGLKSRGAPIPETTYGSRRWPSSTACPCSAGTGISASFPRFVT